MAYSYTDCVNVLATARFKDRGKPIANNTRVFDRGDHMAIQFHRTDIVRFYPDGRMAICTGWTTMTTLERIRNHSGKSVYQRVLPTFNGRRCCTERHHAIDGVVFNGVGGYIMFDEMRRPVLETVNPINVEIITDKKRVAEARRRAHSIATQIRLRAKLGVEGERWDYGNNWLKRELFKPMVDIDYTGAPHEINLDDIRPMFFARLVDATDTVPFRTFP